MEINFTERHSEVDWSRLALRLNNVLKVRGFNNYRVHLSDSVVIVILSARQDHCLTYRMVVLSGLSTDTIPHSASLSATRRRLKTSCTMMSCSVLSCNVCSWVGYWRRTPSQSSSFPVRYDRIIGSRRGPPIPPSTTHDHPQLIGYAQ